jgi:hypothetical protein
MDQRRIRPLRPSRLEILQINVGKVCNQTCRHCHVDAGPDRTESMSRETMEQCLRALARTEIATVDLTGGAPELNPHFRWLVEELRGLGLHVMDRCNLTVPDRCGPKSTSSPGTRGWWPRCPCRAPGRTIARSAGVDRALSLNRWATGPQAVFAWCW